MWPFLLTRASAPLMRRAIHAPPAAPLSPPLSQWLLAVASVPRQKLIPPGLGAETDEANVDAFYGDKVLGAAVARALRHVEPNEIGYMSIVSSEAVSNRNLAQKLEQILPTQSDGIAKISSRALHDAGTMVEAAVAAVDGMDDGDRAIRNLAEWLVSEAISTVATGNSKGRLLEMGGKFEVERLDDFPDHAPVHRVVATLNGQSAEAVIKGGKKDAEMAAAAMLLGREPPTGRVGTGAVAGELEQSAKKKENAFAALQRENGWRVISYGGVGLGSELMANETLTDWWSRGALMKSSLRHARLAPAIFPEHVSAVDAWLRMDGNYTDGMIAVTWAASGDASSHGARVQCFTARESSTQLARRALGGAANRLIAEVVGVSLSERSDDPLPDALLGSSCSLLARDVENSKSHLKALGGSVTAVKIDGYPQHAPRFRAVAELNGQRVEAVEKRRKTAETAAAALLLDALPSQMHRSRSVRSLFPSSF